MYSVCRGFPDRLAYYSRFPLPEGVGDCFFQDVQAPVHVCVDPTSIRRAKQPAAHPLAQIAIVMTDPLTVEETAL